MTCVGEMLHCIVVVCMSMLQSGSWPLGVPSLLIAGHSPLCFVHLAAESAQRGIGG